MSRATEIMRNHARANFFTRYTSNNDRIQLGMTNDRSQVVLGTTAVPPVPKPSADCCVESPKLFQLDSRNMTFVCQHCANLWDWSGQSSSVAIHVRCQASCATTANLCAPWTMRGLYNIRLAVLSQLLPHAHHGFFSASAHCGLHACHSDSHSANILS